MKLRPELVTQMKGSKNAYLSISCNMSGPDRWHIQTPSNFKQHIMHLQLLNQTTLKHTYYLGIVR